MYNLGVKIFSNINFYDRYKSLSEKTRKNDERLDKTQKKVVLTILKELGYESKFVSKGQFYRIVDTINDLDFNLHLCLKYGLVEVILGCKNNSLNLMFGGPASLICESIEYSKGIKSDELVKKPSFDTYEILKEIFKEIISLYEDMKEETLINQPA
ncbi:hypothetical protein BZARG_2804 [Bizionia argentinensis JUB59]|uniref:Uncharacterized protein n=1 Tax=Bizionia argentinensis JUB59 TaxID=1046627 RepID=G2EFJ2_9FLAO|nr:hypothetical protein [Bizionia argentinensis]EGV42796.1 hypothetical protein BZARG_2804 [Bizionia argentinensis JUB59]